MGRVGCNCFLPCYTKMKWRGELKVHPDEQDRTTTAWQDLLILIDEAAKDRREVFEPARELGKDTWLQIQSLPNEIKQLTHVKHLILYGSNLRRIPIEIGQMHALEELNTYTSYELHWYPFEINRCQNLVRSKMSTRALYGNYKYRPPFPALRQVPVQFYQDETRCSVCDQISTAQQLNQVWISIRVATDVLPLLARVCSLKCLQQLPKGAENYLSEPHKGGLGITQPPKSF